MLVIIRFPLLHLIVVIIKVLVMAPVLFTAFRDVVNIVLILLIPFPCAAPGVSVPCIPPVHVRVRIRGRLR